MMPPRDAAGPAHGRAADGITTTAIVTDSPPIARKAPGAARGCGVLADVLDGRRP